MRGSSRPGRRAGLIPIAAIAFLAAACGSNNESSPPSSSPDSATPPTSARGSASAEPSASPTAAPGWHLVVIGDSLAQPPCRNCASFADVYADATEKATGVPVLVDNRSDVRLSNVPPVQTDALRDRLLTDAALREAIASADIVLVNVGFNDTPWNRFDNPCDASNQEATVVAWDRITPECISRVTHETARTLNEIFTQIDILRGCFTPPGEPSTCTERRHADTALRLVTVYNDWIGWADAPPEATQPSARADRAMADAQCWVAEMHGGECVDAFALLNGPSGTEDAAPYLAEDHTHLSVAGAQRIGDALATLGVSPLTP